MAAGLAADARGDGGGEEMSCGGNVDVLIFYVNLKRREWVATWSMGNSDLVDH